jgi:hypothetical protein
MTQCRVGLAQLVRFLVVELIHLGSNPRFDMGVVFMANQRGTLDDRLCESQDQVGSVFRMCS